MSRESENKTKLKAFFDEEYHVLKSYVGSKIRESTHLDAEDILQDVALKLFSGASTYTSINNVAGFVYRSLKNKIIDTLRKSKKTTYNEEINESKLNELIDVVYGVPDNSYSDAMKKELGIKIQNLKPVYREIIFAIDFEGYTYKELSKETGIPIGTLMSRRHRAFGILLKQLDYKKI